jgi:FkbM family methyltransferase
VPSLEKLVKFATDSGFRASQLRAYAWPVVRKIYPQIECIGISGADGKTTLLFADDKFITRDFIKFGHNPSAPLNAALSILKSRGARLNGVFFELGANVGSESIEALNSGFSRALLVEPEPRNAALLRSNIVLNGFADRAIVAQVGASNEPGTATMTLSADNRGDHKIAAATGENQTAIELKTADQILADAGVPPANVSLVWIDTQGYDGFALAGAQSLISARVPFVMEFDPDAMRAVGCLDLAIETVGEKFSEMFNLAETNAGAKPAKEVAELSRSLLGTGKYVDLLLI